MNDNELVIINEQNQITTQTLGKNTSPENAINEVHRGSEIRQNSKKRGRPTTTSVNDLDELMKNMVFFFNPVSNCELGRVLGCSETTIRRLRKKLNR